MSDLLGLIAYYCNQAKKEAEAKNYGWSGDCVALAHRAVKAYVDLVRGVEGLDV